MARYDVPYMQRTRDYYRAQGYTRDYRWAHFDSIPFQAPRVPLASARVAVITTAMPDTPEGRQSRQVYSTPFPPLPKSMYTAELSWDKDTTHTDDVGSFLPLEALAKCVDQGVIGSLAREFHSVPTEYSQRRTLLEDAPEIARRCQDDNVDIALLVPL